jgi:ATP-dependent RNA helicase DeaD
MENFKELGLHASLMQSLEKMNFNTPTPIQAQAIPPALLGRDILGSAQTGTGKTGAFGIPMVNKLLNSPRGSALIMTPTRELAVQVLEMLTQLVGRNSAIKTALLIGGESMPKQLMQLRARPRIIVGTPGRINDHIGRGSLMLADTQFLVLDETDRMLDMGFDVQIEKIIKFLPVQRQTLLFSATLPDNIVKLASRYMRDPVRISAGSTTNPIEKITQEQIHTTEENKYGELMKQLETRTGSIIIFVKTKRGADKMAEKLTRAKYSADTIHGDLRQSKRDRVIEGFRDKKFRILVATDVAARGLDIPHIEHVINYDLPQCPEDYIHRIGRTGRAGAEGAAVNLISGADRPKWKAIHQLINPSEKLDMPAGGHEPKTGGGNRRPGGGNRRFGGAPKGNGEGNSAGNGGGAKRPFQARRHKVAGNKSTSGARAAAA